MSKAPIAMLAATVAVAVAIAASVEGAQAQAMFSPVVPPAFHAHGKAEHRKTRYLDRLEWNVDDAVRYGKVSASDGRRLVSELRQVRPIAFRAGMGNANAAERDRLDRTVEKVERAINGRRTRPWDG
jgi:hypothetical protein